MGETEKVAELFGKLRVIVCKLRLHSRFNIKKFLSVGCEQGCATRGVIAVLVVLGARARVVKRRASLAGTLLTILLGGVEPAPEDGEGLGFDFEEGETAAEVRLDVNDFGFSVEEILAGENFYEHESVLRKRIHHVEVAAVKA